jgi:hypothetical protein
MALQNGVNSVQAGAVRRYQCAQCMYLMGQKQQQKLNENSNSSNAVAAV